MIGLSAITSLKGQDSLQARKWVNALCDESLSGRGYLRKGTQKAGAYLVDELIKLGLKPLFGEGRKGFFQPFEFEVNTFPKAPELEFNGSALVPGKDFIVSSTAPNSKGILDGAAGNQRLKWANKLTWSVGRSQDHFPQFTILRNAADSASLKHLSWNVNAKLRKTKVCNVGGVITGKKFPDQWILITAHYDHLGGMGEGVWFPGANDNASGVAVWLDLARHYQQAGNQPDYTLVFVAFAAEEAGLLGSFYFGDHAPLPLENMRFQLNLDLLGGGSEGVTIVNAYRYPELLSALKRLGAQHGLASVNARDNVPNSDHYLLAQRGFPAYFLYTLGDVNAYHDIDDVPQKLPFSRYSAVFGFLKDWINSAETLSFRKKSP